MWRLRVQAYGDPNPSIRERTAIVLGLGLKFQQDFIIMQGMCLNQEQQGISVCADVIDCVWSCWSLL